jgi:arginine utilization regulatory protein
MQVFSRLCADSGPCSAQGDTMGIERYRWQGGLDFDEVDYLELLDYFDQGVLMTDMHGTMVYYNETQAQIDNLDPSEALGRKISDVYEYDNDSSTCMRCIKHGRPIINYALSYRSKKANVGNTIHSVFPLRDRSGRMIGTICFVKDYNILERTIPSFLMPKNNEIFAEGTQYTFANIIGSTPEFVRALKTAKMSANSPSPVLLFGETGVGKELFAQSIHNFYYRKKRLYIAVNCAAIPETLIEGIFFGTARGAYTGAVDRMGLFERANGGTIFLDEINSMPLGLQGKLLRVLQENELCRVGSVETVKVKLKVISSMNMEPQEAVRKGIIRMDLFYRLAVISIRIPPLRDRKWDIEELTRHFLLKYNLAMAKNVIGVSSEVMDLFWGYDWPGNVRELEHVIESAVNMAGANEQKIQLKHLNFHLDHLARYRSENAGRPAEAEHWPGRPFSLPCTPKHQAPPATNASCNTESDIRQMQRALEIETVKRALISTGGKVAQAARSLGISRQLLHYKLKKYGLGKE